MAAMTEVTTNEYWWPNPLGSQTTSSTLTGINPLVKRFNYAKSICSLNLDAVKRDLEY